MFDHLRAVWRTRHFLTALVGLDLRRRYRRSLLGVGWSFVQPVAMTAVFVLIFSNLLGADPRTYTTFLLLGLAVWGFARDCAVGGCGCLTGNEAYIRQCPLPFAVYPLRAVLGFAIHGTIALFVGLVAVVILRESWAPLGILWAVLPSLLLLLAAGWAVATLTGFAHVYFHDTQHLLEVLAQVVFFLTPIMYRPEVLVNKGLTWLVVVNPVNLFLELIRTPILTGEPPAAKLYVYAAGGTAVLVAAALGTIAALRKKVIFHL